MTEKKPVLKIENLNLSIIKENTEKQILQNISLEIGPQEHWAIAGESGAGKSMTMYALTSLLPEKNTRISGRILYLEKDGSYTDILKIPFKKRTEYCSRKVSLIFQDSINALNPFEKIRKQWWETVVLHHPEMNKQEISTHIIERLKLFGIPDENVLKKYPHQLSGGMKQRIAIAMALEADNDILIADEPTTSLDAVNQRNIVNFIQKLCKEKNLTLLYISHNLALLNEISTHAVILKNGEIIEKGYREEVFHSPQNIYTQKLIKETMELAYEK